MNMNLPTQCCHLMKHKDIQKLEILECISFLRKCPTKRIKLSLHIWPVESWDEDVSEQLVLGLVRRLEIWSQYWTYRDMQTACTIHGKTDSWESWRVTSVRKILVQSLREVIPHNKVLAVTPKWPCCLCWQCSLAAKWKLWPAGWSDIIIQKSLATFMWR